MLNIFKLTLMGAVLVFVTGTAALAQQPVEYVRVCDAYGVEYFYSPGTETCVHASTGETRRETEDGTRVGRTELAARIDDAEDHVRELDHQAAISNALEDPDLISDETFGFKINWGTANGAHAFGLTGTAVVVKSILDQGGRLGISAGIAFTGKEVGGRAGAQITW